MNNNFLRARTARQIDQAVGKVLAEIDIKEPPIDLSVVRRNLKIDLEYYRSTDEGMLREVIHSAKMGAANLLDRVMQLGQVIRQFEIRALWQPARKKILLDSDEQNHPKAKWRWSEAHEIVHSLMWWHESLMVVDSLVTLSPACIYDMEMEANYGAGRLLFLQDRFVEEARSVIPTFANINHLADRYKNTKTSTLWRFVEAMEGPTFGIVGFQPTKPRPDDVEGPCRYFIRSRQFAEQFSNFKDSDAVAIFDSYCKRARGGPLGQCDAVIEDVNGDEHVFHFESWSNTHEALTLATYVGKKAKVFSVAVALR